MVRALTCCPPLQSEKERSRAAALSRGGAIETDGQFLKSVGNISVVKAKENGKGCFRWIPVMPPMTGCRMVQRLVFSSSLHKAYRSVASNQNPKT